MANFSILIVDDEVHAVRGIELGLDWAKLGIEEVYTANSLKQAQDVMKGQRVDLLLTDIDMPGGSGLDLLRWVREQQPEVEAIFLTCHSDFAYAQEAIHLKSLDYLLKPIDYTKLAKAILSAKAKSEKGRKTQKKMQERFWSDLINGKEALPPGGIADSFLLVLVRSFTKTEHPQTELADLLKEEILNRLLQEGTSGEVLALDSDRLLLIIPQEGLQPGNDVLSTLQAMLRTTKKELGFSLACYLREAVPLNKVEQAHKQLRLLDRDNVFALSGVQKWRENASVSPFIPTVPKQEWIELVMAGSKDTILGEIRSVFRSWEKKKGTLTRGSLEIFYQDMLQIIFYVLQRQGLDANQIFAQRLFEEYEQSLDTVASLLNWTLFIVEIVTEQVHAIKGEQSVVERAKDFIRENLGSHGLTRDDVANHVYFNPDYLNRVFKTETGRTLTEYIIESRLERAKELLLETDLTVSEIALQCGYSNFSYFSTLFKKSTNLSPTEFRAK